MPGPFNAHASPMILPSILSADFGRLLDDTRDALRVARSSVVHVDVMDGHLVPNISFGSVVYKWLRPVMEKTFFDVHLMIDEPVRYAADMVKAGADNLTIHIEAPEVAANPAKAFDAIRKLGCGVGLTLKPGTPVEAVLPYVDAVDLVLVMSVEPGFGGQSFMPAMLEKARTLRPLLKAHQRLEIDGGIGPGTIANARAAGVDWFVVGSALFAPPDREAAAAAMLRGL
ncbi:MAG TPA: ribulose-phosphate 3-epimerase [Tepidisphaeraceae bacterium]|jgi:ribulose-phosphate 3-epimerase